MISFDPNLRPGLWPNLAAAREAILNGLQWAVLLKVSEEELEFISSGSTDSARVDQLFAQYDALKIIAVTLENQGCHLYLRERNLAVPGFKVRPVGRRDHIYKAKIGAIYPLWTSAKQTLSAVKKRLESISYSPSWRYLKIKFGGKA